MPEIIEAFETYHGLPCCTSLFIVNGITAHEQDFGVGCRDGGNGGYCYDEDIKHYGCPDRVWYRHDSENLINECLEKYNIGRNQFNDVCDFLERKLSVGRCGWCV